MAEGFSSSENGSFFFGQEIVFRSPFLRVRLCPLDLKSRQREWPTILARRSSQLIVIISVYIVIRYNWIYLQFCHPILYIRKSCKGTVYLQFWGINVCNISFFPSFWQFPFSKNGQLLKCGPNYGHFAKSPVIPSNGLMLRIFGPMYKYMSESSACVIVHRSFGNVLVTHEQQTNRLIIVSRAPRIASLLSQDRALQQRLSRSTN